MLGSRGDSLAHKRIREYEILELIGQGGMGAVYRAKHVFLNEERAIKIIQKSLAEDEQFVRRFIDEARILTKLHHPNLVQLYEFGTLDENTFFMVLEFVRGESVLSRINRENRIPLDEAIPFIRQAAEGLHEAHQKGIIHRDISPDNLLLVENEGRKTIKVIDFGIARPELEVDRNLTASNVFIGKPEYCSPEQCGMLAPGEVLDGRSDIYSLGITFYQMLTGNLPFSASNPQQYFFKHIRETPRPLSEILPAGEVPKSLDGIVQRMLAKRREDRYPTLMEFLNDLAVLNASEAHTREEVFEPAIEAKEPVEGGLFAKRFLIERLLGAGGMGNVYRARDMVLGISVALKVIGKKVANHPGSLERFKREVILARKVSHPNVCRIYDISESEAIPFVSMEYIEGETLADLLQRRGALKPEEALPIVRQILKGLSAAHEVGIIHRDLKPQNIMIEVSGRACIMDFGLSVSSDVRRLTETGVIVGTIHYMSPEQLMGSDVDPRSDIYSMGVILYEILTGRLPFQANRPAEIMMAHISSKPMKPSELAPGLPPYLEEVILTALEKKPEDRFQNVSEILRRLSDRTASGRSREAQESKFETLGRKAIIKRSFRKQILIAGILLSLSLATGYLWMTQNEQSIQPSAPRPAIPQETVTVSINVSPWAYIKVHSSNSKRFAKIPESETITPCNLLLPEGSYSVEFHHPGFPMQSRTIEVKKGQSNSFQFGLPAYDAEKIVNRLLE